MSTDKLKVIKNIKNIDSYSKNPIIDSLIKQKLQSEMKVVKDNFQQFIKKQDKSTGRSSVKQFRKRTLSVQDLGQISPDRIRQSINFNPVHRDSIDFLTQRQQSSPFFENKQIEALNYARTHNEEFNVRMKHSDRQVLEHPQKADSGFYKTLENNVKKKLPEDLWLPSMPQVGELIRGRAQRVEEQNLKGGSLFNLEVTDRPASEGFKALQSSRGKGSQPKSKDLQVGQMTYEHKRYHKGDYQSLQKWLQVAVDFINKQAKDSSTDENNQGQHLNQIYTVYMCGLKQLIRLTYIQSSEKGLILQKLIWSMVRLFQEIAKEQHNLNYSDFKYFSQELKTQREMYQSRMQKLQALVADNTSQISTYKQQQKKLVLTGVSFKKVNEQMKVQIQKLGLEINQLNKQNNYLMDNLIKLIREFQARDIIKVRKTEQHQIYYYLGEEGGKMEVVAKVPLENMLEEHFLREMVRSVAGGVVEGHQGVRRLESVLSGYWQKKMMYLDIDGIVREHFDREVMDIGCNADGRGPQQYIDKSFQYPQQNQQTFEQFLKKQLQSERESWQQKQQQYVQSQISLKDLYNQLKQTIQILTNQNGGFKTTILQKDYELNFQHKKMEILQEKFQLYSRKVQMLEAEKIEGKEREGKIEVEMEVLRGKLGEEKRRALFEKENNSLLVGNIHELKDKKEQLQRRFDEMDEKNELLQKQFKELEWRIRQVAPCLQATMSLPQASDNITLMNLTSSIQKYLSEYVERDAKMFLT